MSGLPVFSEKDRGCVLAQVRQAREATVMESRNTVSYLARASGGPKCSGRHMAA